MRKTFCLLGSCILLCFVSKVSVAQEPYCDWVKGACANNTNRATSVAVDNSGNVFIAGMFYSSTITFGSITLNNTFTNDSVPNIFIVKYDEYGNLLWAKSAGGNHGLWQISVTADMNGNAFVAGAFVGTVNFDGHVLTSADTMEMLCGQNAQAVTIKVPAGHIVARLIQVATFM
jgi:hypothetical protein